MYVFLLYCEVLLWTTAVGYIAYFQPQNGSYASLYPLYILVLCCCRARMAVLLLPTAVCIQSPRAVLQYIAAVGTSFYWCTASLTILLVILCVYVGRLPGVIWLFVETN